MKFIMKNVVKIIIGGVLLAGGVFFFFSNQGNQTNNTENMPLSIVTSFYPLEFALERIVGDFGTVTNVGEGRDPHSFKLSTQDMFAMQKSNLVVLQGDDFEPWGDDVVARLEADNVKVVIATANIELHKGGHDHEEDSHKNEHADEHGSYDPHTWLDPVLFSKTVEYLTEKIVTIDPINAVAYLENAAELQSELAVLDTEYSDKLASCDLDEVITSHDAFGYLAERYNFNVHSIAGLSTQDTPSLTTLAELREEAEEGIGAILLEENSITAYGETLARETGLQSLSLNSIAYIIPVNENYLTLMRKNLDSFATALLCNE